MSLFKLRGELNQGQSLILGIIGFVLLIAIWWILAESLAVERPVGIEYTTHLPSTLGADSAKVNLDSILRADSIALANATEFEKFYPILPTPMQTIKSYPALFKDAQNPLFGEIIRSVWLNIKGYFWAIFISILFGFLIGLVPLLRGLFSKQVNALRYLPLTALTGLFIIWFGIDDSMKIAFLAFGIIVYLLPVVVQRIDEVKSVYLKTVFTLGANSWDTIKSVYIPSVMSKLIDDIRVLTAISWTYIIIVEYINSSKGGLGALIWKKQRLSEPEKLFAILIIIILIGFIQDMIFVFFDRRLFPHKYRKTLTPGVHESQYGIFMILGIVMLMLFIFAIFPALASSFLPTIVALIVVTSVLLILFGEFKIFNHSRKNA